MKPGASGNNVVETASVEHAIQFVKEGWVITAISKKHHANGESCLVYCLVMPPAQVRGAQPSVRPLDFNLKPLQFIR